MIEEQTTLDDLIADSIRNALNSDAIKQRVEAAADKAIGEAISNAFGYSSPFRKGVEESIKAVLPVIEARDVASFAVAARELIMRRLDTLASETAKAHLEEVITQILPDAPVISMKEFEEAFVEKIMRESSDGCDCHGEEYEPPYTWEIEKSSTAGYWDLVYSAKEDARRYDSTTGTMRFRESRENPGLQECWMVSDTEMPKGANGRIPMFTGPLYGFDLMVWRLGTGTAKLRLMK